MAQLHTSSAAAVQAGAAPLCNYPVESYFFDDPVTGGDICISPGWLPSSIAAHLKDAGVDTWAIVSADDAHGLRLSEKENRRRSHSLYRHLRLSGYEPVSVRAANGGRAWFVPGLPIAEARRFGGLFAQGRILVGDGLDCRFEPCEPSFFMI